MSNWDDILILDDQLTEEERLIKQSAKDYCEKEIKKKNK